jgi:hypothetical protein
MPVDFPGLLPRENAMDILYIGLIVGFVAASIGLAYYCERLRGPQ